MHWRRELTFDIFCIGKGVHPYIPSSTLRPSRLSPKRRGAAGYEGIGGVASASTFCKYVIHVDGAYPLSLAN